MLFQRLSLLLSRSLLSTALSENPAQVDKSHDPADKFPPSSYILRDARSFRGAEDDLWDRCWTTESAFTEAEVHAQVDSGQWRPTAWQPASGFTLNCYAAHTQAVEDAANNTAAGTVPELSQAPGQMQPQQNSSGASSSAPVAHGAQASSPQEDATCRESDPWKESSIQDSAASKWLGQ